jgi:hypothetical protein
MRAILIDPEKRTVSEIQLKGGDDVQEINAVFRCEYHAIGAHLDGPPGAGGDVIYVSDDELKDGEDPRFWFQVDADRNPPSSFPIAGFGLALCIDIEKGADCDVRMSVAELTRRITFTQRKFRGFKGKRTQDGTCDYLRRPDYRWSAGKISS